MIPPSLVAGLSEHLLNGSFLITIVILSLVLYTDRVKNKKRAILWTLLIENMFIVLGATLILRRTLEYHRIEMMPLWIYLEVIKGNPEVTALDILFNTFLFLPMGLIIAGLFPAMKLWRVFLIGLIISLGIEIFQYIFYKGVSQVDDLAHNSIGCVVGWYVGKLMIKKGKSNKLEIGN